MLTTVGPTYFQYPPLAKRRRVEKKESGKTEGSIGRTVANDRAGENRDFIIGNTADRGFQERFAVTVGAEGHY